MKLKLTVAEALKEVLEWTAGMTLHEDSAGLKVSCFVVAEELNRLRSGFDPAVTPPAHEQRCLIEREDGVVALATFRKEDDMPDFVNRDGVRVLRWWPLPAVAQDSRPALPENDKMSGRGEDGK